MIMTLSRKKTMTLFSCFMRNKFIQSEKYNKYMNKNNIETHTGVIKRHDHNNASPNQGAHNYAKSMMKITASSQGRRSIFRMGGGGGARGRKFSKFSARSGRYIKLCAPSTPKNWKLCMFSSIYVKFNSFVVPDSAF